MKKRVVRILDGGMGDELFKRMKSEDQVQWSAMALMSKENHPIILELHREFAKAGCDMLTTCNFSVRRHHGYSDEDIRFASAAAGKLAREVALEENKLVLGSLPPLLECFRKEQSLASKDGYYPIIEGLNDYCDFFLGETLSSIAEGFQVLSAIKDKSSKKCMLSFSINGEGTLYSGETASSAIITLLTSSPDVAVPIAILFNCSSPEAITKALQNISDNDHCFKLLEATGCELGVYPNRYYPVKADWTDITQPIREELTPEKFAKFIMEVIDQHQVTIVGGCCGITPEYLRRIKEVIRIA